MECYLDARFLGYGEIDVIFDAFAHVDGQVGGEEDSARTQVLGLSRARYRPGTLPEQPDRQRKFKSSCSSLICQSSYTLDWNCLQVNTLEIK
jgi:hypothetical protein